MNSANNTFCKNFKVNSTGPLTLAILFLIISAVLFSCKKDAAKATEKTRYDLLINKKWQINGETGTINGVSVASDFDSWPDYEKDDYFYFHDNLTYEENAGKLLNPNSPGQILDHGTWQLTTSDQFINLKSETSGIITYPLKIIKLTETTLTVQYTFSDSGKDYVVNDDFISVP